ncbi:class I SAM-dependent methyltransferase [Pseudoalteromonas sp. MMG022]|uniref:class I SAM-dependent methyltransferase n=1 Tax=Pseudoalteromonas sp. MMG022 TaxID=2909978 RepID=UPI001F355F69|nr:class I SAM-dependent methyltransferase [Pseudoalteromonas sp. MMG022]MCF6437601.1 class I SAM-dependent methyltransferase [Pseudoalteromonas sp. MMG022]
MNPQDIGKAYDEITFRWESEEFNRLNGIEAHRRALVFAHNKGKALDVGCGCTGRFIDLLQSEGFSPEGVDVSEKMLSLAKARHPDVVFHHRDICQWVIEQQYDFITAWDSMWHVPLKHQAQVLKKLLASLNQGGVLIFSFGGTVAPDEHTNNAMGPEVYYSTLGVNGFLSLLISEGCICRHLEYEHYPDLHAYLIVEKA